jgi:hypothetical protein
MSTEGRQPAPDFDGNRYERPNKDWLCGHSSDGCPCRLGPSPSGECRAGPECKPLLVTPPGETKGTWKCTRPAEWGGTCSDGPRPDGTCCRSTTPCVPVRSLRSRRGLLVCATIAASVGILLVIIFGPWRATVINPGPLTRVHSGPSFAAAHSAAQVKDAQGCVHCHAAAHKDASDWTGTALASVAPNGTLGLDKLLASDARDFHAMDAACQSCHRPHSFHQADVATATSCSVCHLEHQGADHNLRTVDSKTCTQCHGDETQMTAAGQKARDLPAALFAKQLPAGHTAFAVARPAAGLTTRITSFATDHPEFRLHTGDNKDPNPLAFNHALHLTGTAIPQKDGKPLDCRSCHVPDKGGALMQPISFAQHCQACHGIPVDPTTPSLLVPHGSPEVARAFLRALPAAYTDDAVRRLGLAGAPLQSYVAEKLAALQRLHPSGERLEHQVFFGDPAPPAGRDSCNRCHVIEAGPTGSAPHIAPLQVPDVWLPRSHFDHAKHTQVSCASCHPAQGSSATSDILIPSKATCVSCHSPAGGVTDSCTACHGYHNPPPADWEKTTARILTPEPTTTAQR